MDFPSESHESFIVMPHEFNATRLYAEDELSHMTATRIKLRIACSPIDDDNLSHQELGMRAMVGFQRLKVWLEAILNHVVLIDVNSELLEPMQENIVNSIMYIPGQPDDSMLAVLLHCKLSVITDGLLDISEISLSASDTDYIERNYRNLSAKKEYPLPNIEYFNGETRDKIPWWMRPTVDICEYDKDDEDEDIQHKNDILSEIGKEFLTNNIKADIIMFDAWKEKDK